MIEGVGNHPQGLSATNIIQSYRQFFDDLEWNLGREGVDDGLIT